MNPQYTYLRLSLTDRCNFNCSYCQPALRDNFLKEEEILGFQELLALVRSLAACGIRHVRLTGGEPLLRPQLPSFIEGLSQIAGIEVLSITTNGLLLGAVADDLKKCGIHKINISMDSLKRERFARLTGYDCFQEVMDAVLKVSALGFKQVKLNVILMKGFNDDEILDFVRFGLNNRIDVRFIEFFRTQGRCDNSREIFVPSSQVKKVVEAFYGKLDFLGKDRFAGPAGYFRIKNEAGRVGFISSVSDFFCGECNRLRLSADGKLYPCLYSGHYADLKAPLRQKDDAALSADIGQVVSDKKMFNKAFCSRAPQMSSIGG